MKEGGSSPAFGGSQKAGSTGGSQKDGGGSQKGSQKEVQKAGGVAAAVEAVPDSMQVHPDP